MSILKSIRDGIKELTGIELEIKDIENARFDLMTVLLIFADYKKKELTREQVASISSVFEKVRKIHARAAKGDKTAKKYYRAIEKLTNPPKMNRSLQNRKPGFEPIIDDLLSGYKSSPDFIKAYEIRRLMSQLSFLVKPVCSCNKPKTVIELLNFYENDNKNDNGSGSTWVAFDSTKAICTCERLKPESKIVLRENPFSQNRELTAKVESLFNGLSKAQLSRLTLEGLAKKLFLDVVFERDGNSDISERQLNRALKNLEKHEKRHPEEIERSHKLPVFGGDDLPYQVLA